MKTQQTKDMEQALIRDALRKGKHPALEVPYERKSTQEVIEEWRKVIRGENNGNKVN